VADAEALATLEHVASVLRDLLRFISMHPEVPRRLPMHIYLSVLPFVPSQSQIRHLYVPQISNDTASIVVVSGLENHWDPISVTVREMSSAIDLSPCGTMLVARSDCVRLYNAKSGQLLRSLDSDTGGASAASVVFSSDSRYIAATSSQGIQCWDVATGESVGSCPFPSSSPRHDKLGVTFVPNSEEGHREAWKPNRMHATSLVFMPDGLSVAAGTADGKLLSWRMVDAEGALFQSPERSSQACRCPGEATIETCRDHRVEGLLALPDSLTLLGATRSAVVFWDRATHKISRAIPRCEGEGGFDGTISPPVSVSTDNKLLAIDCDPIVISIYCAYTQQRLCTLSGHQANVTTTAFAPQGRLCSASEDRTVRLWDVGTASQLKCIPIPSGCVMVRSLFSATLDNFILSPGWRSTVAGMIRLAADECIDFGPSHFRGTPRIASDGSVIATCSIGTVMVADVQDLIRPGTLADDLDLKHQKPYRFGYRPCGTLVVLYFVEDLKIPFEVFQHTELVEVMLRLSTVATISHDFSRVAIMDDSAHPSLCIYDVHSGRHEINLPMPKVDAGYTTTGDRVEFSWDSCTVYLAGTNGKLYAAMLPPVSTLHKDEPPTMLAFSPVGDVPIPHSECLTAVGLPNASNLHFLAEGSAWVMNDKKTWNQRHLPSLSFPHIRKIAHSPSGGLIAIGLSTRPDSYDTPNIQIRRIPDYDLVAALPNDRDILLQIRFLDHQPHILVVTSYKGFTCWDAATGQSLGKCNFESSSVVGHHAYNASDSLCLLRRYAGLSELLAVQLQGPDLPARVQRLCFFPEHLNVNGTLAVSHPHPHIIALATRNGVIQIDISKCPLPFTL
jgi:WD40 repeat protein